MANCGLWFASSPGQRHLLYQSSPNADPPFRTAHVDNLPVGEQRDRGSGGFSIDRTLCSEIGVTDALWLSQGLLAGCRCSAQLCRLCCARGLTTSAPWPLLALCPRNCKTGGICRAAQNVWCPRPISRSRHRARRAVRQL